MDRAGIWTRTFSLTTAPIVAVWRTFQVADLWHLFSMGKLTKELRSHSLNDEGRGSESALCVDF